MMQLLTFKKELYQDGEEGSGDDVNDALEACHFRCPQRLPCQQSRQIKEEDSIPQMSSLSADGNLCLGLPHPEFQLSEKKKEKKVTHKPYCDICRCHGNVFIGVPYPETQLDNKQEKTGESICGHHPKPVGNETVEPYSPDCQESIDACQDDISSPHDGVTDSEGNLLSNGADTACGDWLDGHTEVGTHYPYDSNGKIAEGDDIELPLASSIRHGVPFQQPQMPFNTPKHVTLNHGIPSLKTLFLTSK